MHVHAFYLLLSIKNNINHGTYFDWIVCCIIRCGRDIKSHLHQTDLCIIMLVKLQGNFIFACRKNSLLSKVALQSVLKCFNSQFCSLHVTYPYKISSISLGAISCKRNMKIQFLSLTNEETATNMTWHTNREGALRDIFNLSCMGCMTVFL